MQLLSLNPEFATGVMQFHLNTDLRSSRYVHALKLKVTVEIPRVEQKETKETDVDFGIALKK